MDNPDNLYIVTAITCLIPKQWCLARCVYIIKIDMMVINNSLGSVALAYYQQFLLLTITVTENSQQN